MYVLFGVAGITQILFSGQSTSAVVVIVIPPAVGHTYAQIEIERATSAELRE